MMLLLDAVRRQPLGWFEIPVPAFIGRLAGIGSHATLAGQFGTGVFATLLATPCSAPFVGTAVAFALARGPLEIFAIFLALGVGFAAPLSAGGRAAAIAQLLPRPGRWMIVLRRILGPCCWQARPCGCSPFSRATSAYRCLGDRRFSCSR